MLPRLWPEDGSLANRRIANKVVLVEDVAQENLVRRYLERCRHNLRDCRFERAAKRSGGSGEQFVRKLYAVEVKEHRSRVSKGVSALLVVMVDADTQTTVHRFAQLARALEDAGQDARDKSELIIVLIPKRHVETWIRALLGNNVNEEQSYKYPKPTSNEINESAETLYGWTRPQAAPPATCPPSLRASIGEWQKIEP
jgi:hypothetical protein